MTARCDMEALEALALGELSQARATEVEAHAAACASCKRELEWLRAERVLMSRRAAQSTPLPTELWLGIEARAFPAQPKRAARWPWLGGALVATVAAAMLLVFLRSQPMPRHKLDPEIAIDNAEKACQEAISVMEAAVRKRRPDVRLEEWTAKVKQARAAAGADPEARLAVLHGYADYMHSLLDLEENRR